MPYLLALLAAIIPALQPAQPHEPPTDTSIEILEPGDDPEFADLVVALTRPDAQDYDLHRAAGVRIDTQILVAPLVMALGDALDVITYDCAEVAIEGVVGLDEEAGLVLLRLDAPLANARIAVPADEPLAAGDEATIGMVLPIVECGFGTGRSRPVPVLSRRDWTDAGELLHVGLWSPLIARCSPLLTDDDRLQGVIVEWGGAETALVASTARIQAIRRHDPIPLDQFDLDDLAPGTRAQYLADRAGRARSGGDIEAAAALADQALEIDPDCWRALYEAGVCADIHADAAKGERNLRRAIDIEPGFSESWYSLGIILLNKGDNQAAIQPLTRAVEIDPNFSRALAMLAVAHLNLRDMDTAIEYGERSIAADGVEPGHFANLMHFYERQRQADDALRVSRLWTEAFPDDERAWAYYGRNLFTADQWQECITAFERAIELNPNDSGAHLRLALAALQLGDRQRAREAVDTVLQRQPDNPLAKRILQQMAEEDG